MLLLLKLPALSVWLVVDLVVSLKHELLILPIAHAQLILMKIIVCVTTDLLLLMLLRRKIRLVLTELVVRQILLVGLQLGSHLVIDLLVKFIFFQLLLLACLY